MKKIFDVLNVIKQKLFVKKDKIHSEKYYRRIDFLNKYSLLFHAIIAMAIVFIVEIISRRSFISACKFVDAHTLAFMYNSVFSVCIIFTCVSVQAQSFCKGNNYRLLDYPRNHQRLCAFKPCHTVWLY